MADIETCAVCGRTILAGERTRNYLTPDGEDRNVCELCRTRAEQVGWVWEELAGELPPQPPRRRGGGFGGLWRGREGPRPDRNGEGGGGAEPVAEPEASAAEPVEDEVEAPAPAPIAAQAQRRASPDPAAPGARVGRASRVPESPRSRLERALDRFNLSPEARTVAGLMRTLGEPWVSVGAAAGAPGEVRITVAWELSWYQWGVDLKDELRAVYAIDKGHEIDELDSSAREWNGRAEEGGLLRLGA